MKLHSLLLHTIEQSLAAAAARNSFRTFKPLSRVFSSCDLDLGLCKDLSELSCKLICWRHVDIHLFVKDISDTLCYVVREINRWN